MQDHFNAFMHDWNSKHGNSVDFGNVFHGSAYGTGYGLNYVGDNILGTRGKFGGATPGTSIASQYFRNTSWANNKVPKPYQRLLFTKGFKRPNSRTWGAFAGRATSNLGRGVVAISAGMSIYNVATADNTALAVSKEAGGWAGAYVGAQMGAELGTTIGSLFPGAGTLIGGVVGGVIGGAIGYSYGSDFGETIYYDF